MGDNDTFFLVSSLRIAPQNGAGTLDFLAMNPSSGSLLTSLHWHDTGELSDEDLELVPSALWQVEEQSVVSLHRLLQKASLPSVC